MPSDPWVILLRLFTSRASCVDDSRRLSCTGRHVRRCRRRCLCCQAAAGEARGRQQEQQEEEEEEEEEQEEEGQGIYLRSLNRLTAAR